MYPSEYVNRWKLKRILKYGSKWVALQDVKSRQNPCTSIVFNWTLVTYGWLYVPVRGVNRWKLKHFWRRMVLTFESWNTLRQLGENDHDYITFEKENFDYDFGHTYVWIALQVVLITLCVVLGQVFTRVIAAPSNRNYLLKECSPRRQEALGSRS
jgi:hypothetical protein